MEEKITNKLWLKIGFLFFIISFLIIVPLTFYEYIQCSPNWETMCGFGSSLFNLPMSLLFLNSTLSMNILIPVLVISSLFFWFFIGVMIGMIIQKIKK